MSNVAVFSPTPPRRAAFAAAVAGELGVPARAADTPQQAIMSADVVVAAARSPGEAPIVYGEWLAPGAVVVSTGSTVPQQR